VTGSFDVGMKINLYFYALLIFNSNQMKKLLFLVVLSVTANFVLNAQKLLPPLELFSKDKPCYLIKSNGERIDFKIKDLDRKKGLIVNVEGVSTDGKKFELDAKDIVELALAPSSWAQFAGAMGASQSVMKASKTDGTQTGRELVLFYQENIGDKKNTMALLQLLNPDFSSKIRIYHDPFANETQSVSFGGVAVTGGIDKSFFVKLEGKTRKIFKKDYKDDYKTFFGTCPDLIKKFKSDFAWRDFPDHVYFFENECK